MCAKWRIYDYMDSQGRNVMVVWGRGLEKSERARLNSKVELLERAGDLAPRLLSGTHRRHIKKLKVKNNVQLRPMLCLGPTAVDSELTFLQGAIEKDGQLIPSDAEERADKNRIDLLTDPSGKRCDHERFN